MTKNAPLLKPIFDALTGDRIPAGATNIRTYHVTGPSGVCYENELPANLPPREVYETTSGAYTYIATTRKNGEVAGIIREHANGSYVGVSDEYHR